MNAADPQRQGKQGIEDSIQKHYEQTMKGGHNIGNPDLVHYLTDHALESVHWLESIGVKFKDEVGTATVLVAAFSLSCYSVRQHLIRSFEKIHRRSRQRHEGLHRHGRGLPDSGQGRPCYRCSS